MELIHPPSQSSRNIITGLQSDGRFESKYLKGKSYEAKGWSEPAVALMVVYLYSLTPPESFVLKGGTILEEREKEKKMRICALAGDRTGDSGDLVD